MRKDISGIILCGGKSSRMQTNKALLKLKEKTVIEIVLSEMKKVFDAVFISANNSVDYSFLNLPIVNDEFVNRGPLGGIHAALKSSKTEKNFIISCDMPLIPSYLIEYIIDYKTEKKIFLPRANGRVQQLCGIFTKSVISEIETILELSKTDKTIKGSVYELIQRVSTEYIDVDHLEYYNINIFLNMNTHEDYELIKNIYEKM